VASLRTLAPSANRQQGENVGWQRPEMTAGLDEVGQPDGL